MWGMESSSATCRTDERCATSTAASDAGFRPITHCALERWICSVLGEVIQTAGLAVELPAATKDDDWMQLLCRALTQSTRYGCITSAADLPDGAR